jgi:ankyrin repeat protein
MSKTRLLEAVKHLDVAAARRLLDADPSLVTVTERDGRNLLHLACSASPELRGVPRSVSTRLAALLIDRGLDIDTPIGRDACTPLFFAVARARNPLLAKFLLERGAQVTAAPGGGLFAAGWWDDVKTLRLLLRAGAPIDVVVGVTPFLACWGWRRFEAAKELARQGANVNVQDRKGKTALHHGVEKEYDPALLRWLVRHGASPDIPDHTGVSPKLKASRKRDQRFLAALDG